jgi:hypothetical protein
VILYVIYHPHNPLDFNHAFRPRSFFSLFDFNIVSISALILRVTSLGYSVLKFQQKKEKKILSASNANGVPYRLLAHLVPQHRLSFELIVHGVG